MTASRLNLVIQENSAELLKYGTAGPTIIRSVAIYKGDIQSALSKLSTFISQNSNFNNNVNFVVPPDQIKVFRKIVKSEDNKENITFIAKRVLTEQNNIDISEVFLDIISSEDIIEIAVVDRQKLLEAISFIESTGFKIVNAISDLNNPQKSFVFSSQKNFEQKSINKKQPYYGIWLFAQDIINALKSKKIKINNFANFQFIRNLAFLSFAVFVTVVVATAYFDRSVEEKVEIFTNLKSDEALPIIQNIIEEKKATKIAQLNSNTALSIFQNKKELEKTVINPINVFFPTEEFNLSSQRDNPLNNLASSSSKIILKDLLGNWSEILLTGKINFSDADFSTIKIEDPWQQSGSLEDHFLSSNNKEKNLELSIQDNKVTDDPTIDFANKSLLFNDEDKKYKPRLSLEVPENKLRIRPKLRPNKYPFEVKETPKQYARPRVRPAIIEELASKSRIFSEGQLDLSVKPKNRPKIRKRIVVTDYSEEGEEANVVGTISKAATKKSIVKLATTKNAVDTRKLNLLSIYSRGSEKRAIVMFPTGQTKLVKVGDSLDGGRVAAIGTSEIRYIKGGNNLVLRIPEG
ncbi:MAG: hypothetical protein ACJZ82_08810 [Paracoccaceae bacterium]